MSTQYQVRGQQTWASDKPNNFRAYSRQVNSVDGYGEAQYVKWGIVWYAPASMMLYAFGGLAAAIGHHFYFSSLHGTVAGGAFRQQFAIGSGTAISVTIVALLRSATTAAYNQYAWVLVRKSFYKLGTLDKLFALTIDPTGFLSMEMIKHAKVAVLLAVISWITPLAGITPPASLSVVPGLRTRSDTVPMANLDWNSHGFYELQEYWSLPAPRVINIATQSALAKDVIPLSPPAGNSSFSMEFWGPFVKCAAPDSTQQLILDYYNLALLNPSRDGGASAMPMITQKLLRDKIRNDTLFPTNSTEPKYPMPAYSMLVLSAFAPYSGSQGWLYGMIRSRTLDQFNNWDAALPWHMDEMGWDVESYLEDEVVHTLYLQTSTDQHVCSMGNASYHVDFVFENGAQKSVNYTVSDYSPLTLRRMSDGSGNEVESGPYTGGYHTTFELSYMAVWESFTSMVSGNISLAYISSNKGKGGGLEYTLRLRDTSSRSLLTGLSACDEIVNNYWDKLPLMKPEFDDTIASFASRELGVNNTFSNGLMKQPDWMCRNKSLPLAVEDLLANITISMLSNSNLTAFNSTAVQVRQQITHNVYRYDKRNLLISYTSATLLTLLAVTLGIFALLHNGVAHSMAFSAIVATSRNTALDRLTEGQSLGALPLDNHVMAVRLKFGELGKDGVSGAKERLGFGFEREIQEIEKHGKYL